MGEERGAQTPALCAQLLKLQPQVPALNLCGCFLGLVLFAFVGKGRGMPGGPALRIFKLLASHRPPLQALRLRGVIHKLGNRPFKAGDPGVPSASPAA